MKVYYYNKFNDSMTECIIHRQENYTAWISTISSPKVKFQVWLTELVYRDWTIFNVAG